MPSINVAGIAFDNNNYYYSDDNDVNDDEIKTLDIYIYIYILSNYLIRIWGEP